jgi:hypothetical protein
MIENDDVEKSHTLPVNQVTATLETLDRYEHDDISLIQPSLNFCNEMNAQSQTQISISNNIILDQFDIHYNPVSIFNQQT